jgi:hypothetical protein
MSLRDFPAKSLFSACHARYYETNRGTSFPHAPDNLVQTPWMKKIRCGLPSATADAEPVDKRKSHNIPLVSTAITDYFVPRIEL